MAAALSKKHLVCVTWDDAHISLDEYSQGEIERDVHKPCRVNSFGLMVSDSSSGVTLAMQEGVEDGKFRHVNFIPRGMIVSVTDLGIPKVGRKKKAGVKTHSDNDLSAAVSGIVRLEDVKAEGTSTVQLGSSGVVG